MGPGNDSLPLQSEVTITQPSLFSEKSDRMEAAGPVFLVEAIYGYFYLNINILTHPQLGGVTKM